MRILLEDLDAGPVHQKGVVQDEEVVIENAERVTLSARDNSMYHTCRVIKEKEFFFIPRAYFILLTFISDIFKYDKSNIKIQLLF